jgi:hypothetical protein
MSKHKKRKANMGINKLNQDNFTCLNESEKNEMQILIKNNQPKTTSKIEGTP